MHTTKRRAKMAKFINEFEKDIAEVMQKHDLHKLTKTEPEILAQYVTTCIAALKSAKVAQEAHEKA